MSKWHGQLGQDRFVAIALGHKVGGTFADIGAGEPETISNTMALERDYGWRGVLCDLAHFEALRKGRSVRNWIHDDAQTLPWHDALAPLVDGDGFIDYLSLDLEPPELTAEVLLQIPLRDFRFRIASVEHDRYRDGELGWRRTEMMRSVMRWRGYVPVAELSLRDDKTGEQIAIEDWWVHCESGLADRIAYVLKEVKS